VIPDPEADLLSDTVMDAVDAAAAGRQAEGYDLLRAGLRQAEELRNAGETWDEDLVYWWQGAFANYCDSYGVPVD
jgi:hypothetical protein